MRTDIKRPMALLLALILGVFSNLSLRYVGQMLTAYNLFFI